MTQSKIIITCPIPQVGIELLKKQNFQVKVIEQHHQNKKDLIEQCQEATAIISMLSDPIDREFLTACKNLKAISNYAVGFNNIDLQAAKDLGIKVGNTPDVLTDATAELTLGLMLAATRYFKQAISDVQEGKWKKWEPMGYHGPCLKGKTLGIFGMGRIGQAVAKKAHFGFDMKIIHNGHRPKEIEYSTNVDFKTLLKESDFISLHCPLTEKTEGLFNEEVFHQMKKGSWLFNTARGQVHCEQDLIKALESGHLGGAGLDVTNPEPIDPNSPLLQLNNCLVLPHIGSATIEARNDMSNIAAQNIINALQGKQMIGSVI